MRILLKPVIDSLQTIKKDGIVIKTSSDTIKCYAKLKVGVFIHLPNVVCYVKSNILVNLDAVCLHPVRGQANGA